MKGKNMKPKSLDKKHVFGMVKVGEKGQIVIPKSARDLFGITPGSSLLVIGDEESGIALITNESLSAMIQMASIGFADKQEDPS